MESKKSRGCVQGYAGVRGARVGGSLTPISQQDPEGQQKALDTPLRARGHGGGCLAAIIGCLTSLMPIVRA